MSEHGSDTAPRPPQRTPKAEVVGLHRTRRSLVVIDLVESVRLMHEDEDAAIRAWRAFTTRVRTHVLPAYGGTLVKSLGDGLMLSFDDIHAALAASRGCLEAAAAPSREGGESPLRLRVGVHAADVVVDELDIYGSGVNLAARLATLAGPDEIVISADVRDHLLVGVDPEVEDLGECWLKHYPEPVRAWRLDVQAPSAMPQAPDRADLRPTLAILPLDASGEDPTLDLLGELFASEVQSLVRPNASIRVIARPSSAAAAHRGLARDHLARVLGADYVLSGRISGTPARLSLLVEITERGVGDPLWQQALVCSTDELHAAQSPAVAAVAEAAGLCIIERHLQLGRLSPLPQLDDHALLVAGVTLMHRFSRHDFSRAHALLAQLRERAPRHPLPLAWLARWHLFAVIQGWSADVGTDSRQALDLARRALDLDPESSLALTIAGSVRLQLHHEIDTAESLYRQALAANPQESLAWLLLGTLLGFRSQGDDAVRHTELAVSLSPVDPMRFFYDVHGSATALAAGRYERSITLAQRAMKANRQHTSTYRSLAIAQVLSGRLDDARATVQELLLREPGYTVQAFLRRSAGARFGQGERFGAALREAGLPEGA